MCYNEGMEWAWFKEWAPVIGAGITLLAVLVALGIGVSSIIQTNRLKKAEKKERLLNEIIDWASEILYLTTPQTLSQFSDERSFNGYLFSFIKQSKSDIGNLIPKNYYILGIANVFGMRFIIIATNLVKDLLDYTEFLDKWYEKTRQMSLDNIVFDKDDLDEMECLSKGVATLAFSTLDRDIKIKTAGIG